MQTNLRSSVAWLVLLMAMLGCFALLEQAPLRLTHHPGNLAVGLVLFLGAAAVASRRPWSFPAGLAAALIATVGGLLSMRAWLGMLLPGRPLIWVVAGLYVAFRLTLNQHAVQQASVKARLRGDDDGPPP